MGSDGRGGGKVVSLRAICFEFLNYQFFLCSITRHILTFTERVMITLAPRALWGAEALGAVKALGRVKA